MASAFLFTAPVAFFPAVSIPPASAYTLGLRRFSSQDVSSHHEDVFNVVADTDRSIITNDVPAIIVSSATLASIHEPPAINTPAPFSPRSSVLSAFTTSSSSSRTSLTTSIRKTFRRLSLRSSSPSPPLKRSMAQDMDMDLCCRGEHSGSDEDEDEDNYHTAVEDLIEDSTDASAIDSPDAAPLTPFTTHNIVALAVEPSSAICDLESVILQGESVEAPTIVASSEATLSDKPSRSSSPTLHGSTSKPATASSYPTSSRSSNPESTKATELAFTRTMRCAVGTCSASAETCAHFPSAQAIVRAAKMSRRKAVASWVRGLARRAA